VTAETFEVEFVAFNQFLEACGHAPYSRTQFEDIVAKHNARLVRRDLDASPPEA